MFLMEKYGKLALNYPLPLLICSMSTADVVLLFYVYSKQLYGHVGMVS